MFSSLILVVAISITVMSVTVQSAAVTTQDCGDVFQSKLTELLLLKETCDSALYKDCCQVSHSRQQVNSMVNQLFYLDKATLA